MGKLISTDKLSRLVKALDNRINVSAEELRALIEEVRDMFGGRSLMYLTQAEYDALDEEAKNDETISYFITDAEDLSHEHENKEFLDSLSQTTFDNINSEISDIESMFGGKSLVYVTQAEFDALSEEEKSNESVMYIITDAKDDIDKKNIIIDLPTDITAAGIVNLDIGLYRVTSNYIEFNEDPEYFKAYNGTSSGCMRLSNNNIISVDMKRDGDTRIVCFTTGFYGWFNFDGNITQVGTTNECWVGGWVNNIDEDNKEDYLPVTVNAVTNYVGEYISNKVVQVDVVNGKLTLTDDKYQKTTMVDGTEIVFPTVTEFTEIHLYFSSESNMNLTFPDCKWRVEPNIEAGSSYEIIATYNTIEWLVNCIVYS